MTNDDEMDAQRAAMVQEIARQMDELGPAFGRAQFSPRVLAAMTATPRHLFVPEENRSEAYHNRPLAIGYRQTISQPFIVALMTDVIDLTPDDSVLEIGTGSGYQTAILSRLAARVFTIENCAPLAERAAGLFAELGRTNIETCVGDGHLGWPDKAPFDAIMVTAAPPEIPQPLIDQLKPGGRMAVPIGRASQKLIVVEKKSDQSTILRDIISVCFVPLTRTDTAPE